MIDKGSYIRKKNFGFFKNFYLDGRIEYLPSIQVISITQNSKEKLNIHGQSYLVSELVEITEAESSYLNNEFLSMDISLSISDASDMNAHIRKDNGEPKISRGKDEALMYSFTFNQKNPGVKMNVYKCHICGNLHCGTNVTDNIT